MTAEFCKYNKVYNEQQEFAVGEEFKRLERNCYLEHAGAALYSEKQMENIFSDLTRNLYGNPHALNQASKLTEDAVDIVRYQILSHFKTNSEEYSVIFTSGATAALKLVGECFCYEDVEGCSCGSFVYLQDNHTSVMGMREYAKSMRCLKINDAFALLSSDCNEILSGKRANSLFAFPAQSNFSGTKYPLSWIDKVKKGALDKMLNGRQNWFVLLDAACYVSTNELDLSTYKPDFVTISFYKMFGYPTGLGALLVRNSSCHMLKKRYFGGGTVLMVQTLEESFVFRNVIHERFEDGSLPFLSVLALRHGFDTIKRLGLNFDIISKHTFSLAQYVYRNLTCLHYPNGKPVAILYHNTTFRTCYEQGAIINFNLLRDNGEYIGYNEVLHFSNLYGIHLRTGCFCNPGACQHFLNLTPQDIQRHFEAGHVCGDQHDLVDGYPTGSVRISFGYMSTKRDADKFLEMISNCFLSGTEIKKNPHDYYFWEQGDDIKRRPVIDLAPMYNTVTSVINSECGVLQQILLYPIKSCGAFSVLDKWPITPAGLKYDRQWMIINSSGVCVTQKHNKQLCLIRPIIDTESKTLVLTYPGQKHINVPMNSNYGQENDVSLCQSKVCGDKVQGWDCGDEVANWFCDVLNCPGLRLLRQCSGYDENVGRTSRKSERLQLSLANKAQYLMINEVSVKWLREKVSENILSENLNSTILRFRPNFVVKFKEPFMENNYPEFVLNGLRFKNGGKCTRCQMICIDQETGKTSQEPLQTLSREFKGKISFGIYLNQNTFVDEQYLYTGCRVNFGKSAEE